MVQIQILSKVIATHDMSLIEDNALTIDYFIGYEDLYEFVTKHYQNYGNVPDESTFLSEFPEQELVEVAESDAYLVDKIREEYLYSQSVPIMKKYAELLKSDSNTANEYLSSQIKLLQPNYNIGGVDIVSQANERFKKFQDIKAHPDNWFFESGFKELDDIIRGIKREEEFFVILARTNQGKSWILEKICTHIWQTGFNVGYLSPEMTANSIGFRFDTLHNHFKNRSLSWGKTDLDEAEYKKYIDDLQNRENKFIVSTPKDFSNNVTVSKLKNWIKKYKLDAIAIDGITYVSNERGKKNDNKTTTLTDISEDLMSLSVEMHVPVMVVVQANRSGVVEESDGTPELESIRDSDGIAHNASKVIAVRQKKDNILELGIKKNRDGAVGGKLNFRWDIDSGEFVWIPSYDDAKPKSETEKTVKESKKQYKKDSADVF